MQTRIYNPADERLRAWQARDTQRSALQLAVACVALACVALAFVLTH
jgi:hypothetical protein